MCVMELVADVVVEEDLADCDIIAVVVNVGSQATMADTSVGRLPPSTSDYQQVMEANHKCSVYMRIHSLMLLFLL